jgi:hypothetical protein
MAVVYRARDPQLLREVAVKVLHPHLSSDVESRKRFLREAQAAARLRHPNIVEIFDFSVEADRESFMVTELLDGPTLRRFADGRMPLPAEVVAAIGAVICDALTCAHGLGIVHRDVKPDNILLHKGGILKLTDFGIAHIADGNGMTVTGQILGSPAHMAPEQIDSGAIDARTDLFSLGTVLYVLAVGRLPFEAPVAHALLRKILESDFTDPVRAEPKVGERFAAIIRRCMARRIEDRYADAAALKVALCEFCAEIGWDDPAKKLSEFFADPDGFVAEHNRSLIELLPEQGRKSRDAGRVPEAMALFNRALALDPTNVKVVELVRSVAKRRQQQRAMRAAALVGATAAVSAAAVVGVLSTIRHRSAANAEARHTQSTRTLRAIVGASAASIEAGTSARASVDPPDASAQSAASLGTMALASADAGAPRGGARSDEVRIRLVLRGPNGRVAIDGMDLTDAREHRLRTGVHQVQIVPDDANCERPQLWRVEVRPQPGDFVQELTSPTYVCHTQTVQAAARSNPTPNARVVTTAIGTVATTQQIPVKLIIRGLNGLISIDNREPHEHDNGNEYPLTVGSHSVQIIPDANCARPRPWRIDVQPTADGTPLRLTSPLYPCIPRTMENAPPS